MVDEQCQRIQQTIGTQLADLEKGADASILAAHRPQGALQLIELREISRAVVFSTEELKDTTAAAKARLDQSNLQLQNLLYEKNHYINEIKACQDFASQYSDADIELMPEADFRATAAAEFLEGTTDNPYKLMLQRLAHETQERKEVVRRLEELRSRKDALAQALASSRKFLESLASDVKEVKDKAKPLQEKLGAPPLRHVRIQPVAQLLPQPLYIIYMQAVASQQAFDLPISVTFHGLPSKAEEVLRAAREADQRNTSEATVDKGQPAAKRQKRSQEDEGPAAALEDPYQEFPLSVILWLLSAEGAKGLGVHFQHLPALGLVTARAVKKEEDEVLAALYTGDSGLASPSEHSQYLLGGTFQWDTSRRDRPYRWAQYLAGVDFVPNLAAPGMLRSGYMGDTQVLEGLSAYKRQQRIRMVVQRISEAKASMDALRSQLQSLGQLRVPLTLPSPAFPVSPTATLYKWQETGAGAHRHPPRPPAPAPPSLPASHSAAALAGPAPAESEEEEGAIAEEGELPSASERGPLSASQPGAVGEDTDMAEAEAPTNGPENGVSVSRGASSASQLLGLDLSGAAAQENAKIGRTVKVVCRRDALELEAEVSIYVQYPVPPPRIQIRKVSAVQPGVKRSHSRGELAAVATGLDFSDVEKEVNLEILEKMPPSDRNQTLSYQIMQLLLSFDAHAKDWAAAPTKSGGQHR
ncbi:hypothetical protein WJX72_005906 [[Myrmecia] bisecta]|uniref:THO complex subunit 5 n=1 Tax=[Myrmecia] bisecta TaxID=41462 RepID=A0AAW1PCZ6_9CHLO